MNGSIVRPSLPVSASRHESSSLMMPEDANLLGNVFGGAVMALMDKTAAVCAMRHARQQCVTVSVDRIEFRELANVRYLEDVFLDPVEILVSDHAAHAEAPGDE